VLSAKQACTYMLSAGKRGKRPACSTGLGGGMSSFLSRACWAWGTRPDPQIPGEGPSEKGDGPLFLFLPSLVTYDFISAHVEPENVFPRDGPPDLTLR